MQYNGGQGGPLFEEPIELFADWTDLLQKSVYLLSVTLMLIAQAVLFGLAHGYLRTEQVDGTPITEAGTGWLKKLYPASPPQRLPYRRWLRAGGA